ncbi:MAG: hypothetical protein IKA90_06440 [Clostridia bacterium]|nr:hypothetical protein [Clostridia bacterium]
MKKKIFAIALALVLVFGMLTFVGCGSKNEMVFCSSPIDKLVLKDNQFEFISGNKNSSGTNDVVIHKGTINITRNIYTFNATSNLVETYINGELSNTQQENPFCVYGISIDDNYMIYGNQLMYQDKTKSGFCSLLPLEYGSDYDLIFPLNTNNPKEYAKRWLYFIGENGHPLIDENNFNISVDTTKEGTTTAKITYKGQTKTFNALVTSENHSSFSNYPDTIFCTW